MPVAWMHADMLEYPMQTITNTVNCVGAMGKGLALQFKRKFPMYNDDYILKCRDNKVKVGKPYLFKDSYLRVNPPYPNILSFPTKYHWKDPSKLSWIEDGLDHLTDNYKEWGITSLSIPKLGCGLGGLEWYIVKKIMFEKLDPMKIIVVIHV